MFDAVVFMLCCFLCYEAGKTKQFFIMLKEIEEKAKAEEKAKEVLTAYENPTKPKEIG